MNPCVSFVAPIHSSVLLQQTLAHFIFHNKLTNRVLGFYYNQPMHSYILQKYLFI